MVAASLFDWLEADLAACEVGIPELPFGFTLGWAGYLGYELKAECGADRAHRSPHPDVVMVFADRAVAFDHQGAGLHLLALAENGDDRAARRWLDRVAALLATLAASRPHRLAAAGEESVNCGFVMAEGNIFSASPPARSGSQKGRAMRSA